MAAAGVIGAILLAAGASRRFGAANKLLAPLRGRAVVVHAAEALLAAEIPVIAVLGHEAETVRAALRTARRSAPAHGDVPRDPGPIRFARAPDWEQGMGRVIAAGAAAVPPEWDGALMALGDMPFVDPFTLAALARAVDRPTRVAVPVHGGRRGNPVGFGRAWFERLGALKGDHGARALLGAADTREIAAPEGVLADIDTPADLPG